MKKIFAIIAILLLPALVLAQAPAPAAAANGCSGGSLTSCVNQIYIWSMGAAAVLALIMIIIGGYITLTSAGNAERASRGKSYITSSLLGLILLFGAYLLLRTINPDLVDFSNNCINNIETCGQTQNSTTIPPHQ